MFAVEYSVSQKAFHVQTLENMLVNNIENIKESKSLDYIPVGFCRNEEDANSFIEKFKKIVLELN